MSRVTANAGVVPQEAKGARHWRDQRLRLRELQPESFLEDFRQICLLAHCRFTSPLRTVRTRWRSDENDEVISVPNGIKERQPARAITIARIPGSDVHLRRIG